MLSPHCPSVAEEAAWATILPVAFLHRTARGSEPYHMQPRCSSQPGGNAWGPTCSPSQHAVVCTVTVFSTSGVPVIPTKEGPGGPQLLVYPQGLAQCLPPSKRSRSSAAQSQTEAFFPGLL